MIQSHHWPQIKFFSSKGQESHHLSWLSNNLSSWELIWDSSGQVKDAWSSSSLFSWQTHFLLYFINSMVCLCVCDWLKEAHMCEARSGSKSLVLRWPHTTYGRNPVGGLYQPANIKRHPMSPPGEQTKMDETCGWNSPFLAKLSGLCDHFITSWELELLT